jgi:hypothetical protein
MTAPSHVFTTSLLAPLLGMDQDQLDTIVYDNLDPEDGRVWVYGPNDQQEIALSWDALDAIVDVLADERLVTPDVLAKVRARTLFHH